MPKCKAEIDDSSMISPEGTLPCGKDATIGIRLPEHKARHNAETYWCDRHASVGLNAFFDKNMIIVLVRKLR